MTFDGLKNYKKIKIIGHNLRDFDSMMSGVLLEFVLKKLGVNAQYRLIEDFKDEFFTKVRGKLGFDADFPIGIEKDDVLFLVDHTCDYDNKIVGCFDHHPKVSRNWDNYLNIPRSACAKVIYDYAVGLGIDIPKNYLIGVILACYCDTMSFITTKALPADKKWCEETLIKLGLDSREFEKRGYGITDKSLPFSDYIRSNAKIYNTAKGVMKTSYIVTDGCDFDAGRCVEEIKNSLGGEARLWCFISADVVKKHTAVYLITPDYHIFAEAEGILSRGKDIIPFVLNYLASENDGELTGLLIDGGMTFSSMESCTSGAVISAVTDYEGSSAAVKGGFVTYSNETKIKAGVRAETIEKYGVYSLRTACEMAKVSREYYDTDISVGVTGTFGNTDENNPDSVAGEIYFAVDSDKYPKCAAKLVWHNVAVSRKEIKRRTVDIIVKTLCATVKNEI